MFPGVVEKRRSGGAHGSAPSQTKRTGPGSTLSWPISGPRSADGMSFEMQRHALRSAVVIAVGPTLSPLLVWSASVLPTLQNAEDVLRGVIARCCADAWHLLRDSSAPSALDGARGNWEPLLSLLASGVAPTIEAMSAAFEAHILPLGAARGTRVKAWRNWRTVLTWAAGRDALGRILPMDRQTLQAMVWEFTAMGGSRSTIKSVLDAVISRHRDVGLPSPLQGHLSYTRFVRCIARLLGTQLPHKFPVTRDMVVRALRFRPTTLVAFRNKLVLASMTLGCMRPSEAAWLQSCDWWFDDDANRGLVSFRGGATLNCSQRKQDQERKGHHMRFGRANDPDLDLVFQMGLFFDMAGLRPRSGCTKRARPHAVCPVCPPAFPKFQRGPNGSSVLNSRPASSPSLISEMVASALRDIGVDATGFSGVCCRMGGLTVAIEAGVPEHILWMQSGHSQDKAARRYVRLMDPNCLYDTWRAFRL